MLASLLYDCIITLRLDHYFMVVSVAVKDLIPLHVEPQLWRFSRRKRGLYQGPTNIYAGLGQPLR